MANDVTFTIYAALPIHYVYIQSMVCAGVSVCVCVCAGVGAGRSGEDDNSV